MIEKWFVIVEYCGWIGDVKLLILIIVNIKLYVNVDYFL